MFCYMPQSMISLMKQQFVVTHRVRQTEILAILDKWIANMPSVNILCQRKITSAFIFG